MFDQVINFFLGDSPADPHMATLWYLARLMIGVLLFDALFDLFRFAKRLVPWK